jgi:hypothetical protein
MPPRCLRRSLALVGLGALVAAGPAWAETDLFSRDTLSGLVDIRLASAGGEAGWIDGGYGKTRYGDETTIDLGEADLIWKPRFSWEWSGTVIVQAQPNGDNAVDIGEAFVTYKPVPHGPTRLKARAGLFYPDISLEHEGPAWSVSDTITPSAINSWVGEEIKVAGLEVSVSRTFGLQEVTATVGLFTHGDTAGTLLSFRGWALHDLRSTASGHFPLPPLRPFIKTKQPKYSTSVLEIDSLTGRYGRLAWRRGPVMLDAFYYDNRGDRISRTSVKEWAWDTRFWAVGADVDLTPTTRLRAQALEGVTLMGFSTPAIWVDVDYQAAYVMLTQAVGEGSVSMRYDRFETGDATWIAADPNMETGWAATAAWKRPLGPDMDLVLEALHVSSDRPGRVSAGLPPERDQTVLQSALRMRF